MEIFASPRNAEARRVAAVAMFWEPADMAVIAGIRCAEPLERGALGGLGVIEGQIGLRPSERGDDRDR